MRYIVISVVLLASFQANAQALQILPAPTAANCEQRSKLMEKWLTDWPQLGRYQADNSRVQPPKPGESRVVFLGDSITDSWNLPVYFPGKPYFNRGISAQTTPNLLLRFRQDVIALQPKVVIILAGTNDIAGNTGPISLDDIENNFASMIDLAHAHHIAVVVSSVLPVSNYTQQSQRFFAERPMDQILALNQSLKKMANNTGSIYLDYFSATVDNKGMLKRELSEDGLHPNAAGYRIMASLAEQAIANALRAQK